MAPWGTHLQSASKAEQSFAQKLRIYFAATLKVLSTGATDPRVWDSEP